MNKLKYLLLLSLCLLVLRTSFASNISSDDEESNVKLSGTGYIMFGQIGSGHAYGRTDDNPIDHHWQNFYSGRIDAVSEPNEWFTTHIGVEGSSSFPVLRETTIMKSIFKTSQKSILPVATGTFHFNINDMSFLIESGFMEYAFNTEVKNLGNYMYRTTAYPFNIKTKLDYIYSNLMGIRAQTGLLNDQLKFEALINSIVDASPFFDFNLGLFASYATENKLIDASLGVVFERFLPVDPKSTDCEEFKDQLGDTTATMRGTKIDARLTFDIKKLFGDIDILGPNDAKIYGEGAIIGLKDPDFYHYELDSVIPKPSLFNRIPLMFGLNIPTFKILDLLSVEVEYCKYPYPFDWWGALFAPSPKPKFPVSNTEKDSIWRDVYVNKDNLKWTFYLKKSISKFDIIGMIANDHIMYETFDAESQNFTEQSLRDEKDWHWYIKLQYHL
jgi:hypothetical protein